MRHIELHMNSSGADVVVSWKFVQYYWTNIALYYYIKGTLGVSSLPMDSKTAGPIVMKFHMEVLYVPGSVLRSVLCQISIDIWNNSMKERTGDFDQS